MTAAQAANDDLLGRLEDLIADLDVAHATAAEHYDEIHRNLSLALIERRPSNTRTAAWRAIDLLRRLQTLAPQICMTAAKIGVETERLEQQLSAAMTETAPR